MIFSHFFHSIFKFKNFFIVILNIVLYEDNSFINNLLTFKKQKKVIKLIIIQYIKK